MNSLSDAPSLKTVQFQHSFFRTNADGHFRLDETSRRPVYVINLGDQAGIVSFPAIRQELLLENCGTDHAMLDAVSEALKFVRDIRIGDTLPSEVVSGEASWEPEARHRKIANRRIVTAMVRWSGEWDGPVIETRDLRRFLAEQVDQDKLPRALDKLENSVAGAGEGLAEILPVLTGLTLELSYIEAVRENVERIRRIGNILEHVRRAGGGQASDVHEVAAVLRVFNIMLQQFDEKLDSVDDRVADILTAVSEYKTVRAYFRQVRNDLRFELMAWEEPLAKWDKVTPKSFDLAEVAPMIGDLYRFLAPLYAPVDEWVRMGKFQEIIEPDRGVDSEANS